MGQKIKFFNSSPNKAVAAPVPASAVLPEWYKNQNSYTPFSNFEKKPVEGYETTATVKKCIPFFDALTSGYMLLTPCDIYVEQRDGQPYYFWSLDEMIGWHSQVQFSEYPGNQNGAAKMNNPWGILTPKGYSCLFIPPTNRENVISIFAGVVDTDSFNRPVFLPFFVTPGFSGLIPEGTPYAQVYPFKRESWSHTVVNEESPASEVQLNKLKTVFFDKYKRFFWSKKEYK
jgi:hypothetical protein